MNAYFDYYVCPNFKYSLSTHRSPVRPGLQRQLKSSGRSWHMPPFWQGLGVQLSGSNSHSLPEKPATNIASEHSEQWILDGFRVLQCLQSVNPSNLEGTGNCNRWILGCMFLDWNTVQIHSSRFLTRTKIPWILKQHCHGYIKRDIQWYVLG